MDDSDTRIRQKLSARSGAGAAPLVSALIAPPLEPDAADSAKRVQTANALREHLEYWIRKLEGVATQLQLPTDRPRRAFQSCSGSSDRVHLKLSTALTKRLRNLARQHHVSVFATLVSGWVVLLGRWSEQEEVLLGTRTLPRWRSGIERAGNTVALRLAVKADSTVEQLLKHVESTLAEAHAHWDVPIEHVAAALQPARHDGPLLQVLIELNDVSTARGDVNQQPSQDLSDEARTAFELILSLNEANGRICGTLKYASELFERETIERMVACWEVLLKGMVKHSRRPIGRVAMLPMAERERVLYGFNDTATCQRNRMIHELFEEQVERTPEAVAVEYEGKSLTYAQLNGKANQLARYLREKGVRPDELVGICVERGLEMVVGLLGILKAGGAYLPLDPNYPRERLQHMLEDAVPQVVLTQEKLRTMLPATQAEMIVLDAKLREISTSVDANLPSAELGLSAWHLVYVIYTSGSTGRPKGTAMAHRSMVNLIEWHRQSFPANEGKRVLQFAALSFDVAFQETFSTLCTGGSLVMLDEWVRRDVRALTEILNTYAIERLFVPPLMLQSLAEYFKTMGAIPRSLKDVITAGEQLRISPEIAGFFEQLKGCRLHNHYGPTETHVVTALTLTGDPGEWPALPSIGRPISNTQMYVLDGQLQPVPIGVAGEIYIGGANIARGYLNRPELTTERFLHDPFSTDAQGHIYKTGDLGRWRADGTLEYLGRNDDQVKIRGFRIELGEIESHLARHDQVKEAAVVAREDVPGEKRLVAYITRRHENGLGIEELRAHLKAVVPEHMIPSAFVMLESLPLTPSGKLDRRVLPAPDLSSYVSRHYEAPQGKAEEVLADIWQELLRVERVGRQDNFFELGGHSLLIVQMMERLRRVGLSVDVHRVFGRHTLKDLAHALADDKATQSVVPPNLISTGSKSITPQMLTLVDLDPAHIARIVQAAPGGAANIQDIYPLAPLQEGLLFHHLLDEQAGDTYVLPTLLSVPSRERLEELIAALQAVIDRHDVLRTAIHWEQLPQPVQVVYRRATLPVEEISLDRGRDPIEQLKERMRPDHQHWNLHHAPLMRLQVAADLSSVQWFALLQLHHIVDDDISLKILISEVVAHLEGHAEQLPVPIAYRNHVAQALSYARTHDAEGFFRSKLAEIDAPTAPFGLTNVHGDGSRIDEAHEEFELPLAQRVRIQARNLGVSAATMFHATWALVVSCTSGRDDVVFGSVLLGRLQGSTGAQRILGMFINTLPLRLRLQDVTARELVEQTQRELVDLVSQEQASLVAAQRCSGIIGSTPLFSSVLNYRHSAILPEEEWARAAGIRVHAYQYRTNYPIGLSVDDLGNGFALTAHTERGIDPRRILGYVRTAMQSLVEALELAPRRPALTLAVLPESERCRVIELFNATQVTYPQAELIHELFEKQVERTPQLVAVVYAGQSLTFAELNGRANRLARFLTEKGVGPDQLVGICVERSLEMVVGLLGILKAGAAYVPLDPDYPAERLARILEDAVPRVVLTQARLREGLPKTVAEVVALDVDWAEIAERSSDNPHGRALGLRSHHLAYVIYTSGSTGKPKGVMIEHRNVLSLWQGLEEIYREAAPCQRIAVNASFNFDASVKQFVQLLSGRTIVLIPQESRWDASMLLDFMNENQVDGIDCTPSQLRSWVSAGLLENDRCRLRLVLVGGEAIDAELWRELAQCSHKDFFNVYGPTESTVDTTFACLKGGKISPHIGRPMENRRVYILQGNGQPLPIGVPGEMYIGGAGIARGYLNQPVLTAERFITDPFSADSQTRLYKTGDMGRWRDDGTIEYLGRNDQQLKIRGFRIELGDIEAQLLQHPQVKEAVVLAREDELGDKRLVAYVVADLPQLKALLREGSDEAGADMIAQWKSVHDETYSVGTVGPSFVGWNSSYTGQPIPEAQMQEWLTSTIERIQALGPNRILEIGCGVGLLLQNLAPECSVYVGTDFSAPALDQLQVWMSGQESLDHVELLHRSATELLDLESGSFDTVVLNSVVQYFPDMEYFLTVLQEATRLLSPDGKIFLGDIRHLGLLPVFHSAVQLSKAGATVNVGQIRKRIARAVAQEKELVIDPQFFLELPGRLPGIRAAEVQLKRGQALNELTSYRYDVVLHASEQTLSSADRNPIDWKTDVGSIAEYEEALAERRWRAVNVKSIPNGRLVRELAAQRLIETSSEQMDASALRRQLKELQVDGVDPEKIWGLANAHGYDVTVTWSTDAPEYFEAQLLDRTRTDQVRAVSPTPYATKPWRAYANDPLESSLRQQLIPQLREHLEERLPEYMTPSAWVVLKQLPLTPNGKVDRRALPTPQSRSEEMGEYLAPRTDLERTLADIWAQVLRVDQVGVKDNFFELGGHSLLAMQVLVRIRASLSIGMSMRMLFEFPTIEQLSAHLRHARLLENIAQGGPDINELLESVASMSESEVKKVMRELSMGGKI